MGLLEANIKAKTGDAYDAEAAQSKIVKMFALVEQQQEIQEEEESTALHEEAPQELREEKQNTAEASGDADTTKAKSRVPFADLIAVVPLELKERFSENQMAGLEACYNHLDPDSQDALVHFLRREATMKTKKGDAYDAETARKKIVKMFAFVAAEASGNVDTTKAKCFVPFADFIAVVPLELKEQLSENQIVELEECYNNLGQDSRDVLEDLLLLEANMKAKTGDAYDAEAARTKIMKMFALVKKKQGDSCRKSCTIM